MRNLGFVVFTALLGGVVLCDIEHCSIIKESIDLTQNVCPSSINSDDVQIDLTCLKQLIVRATIKDKSNPEKDYDGFLCAAQKENTFHLIRPCKKYIQFVASKNGSMPKTMKCFRQIDTVHSRTKFVIVLNEKGDNENVYKRLIQADSFAIANQFLHKLMGFLAESNAGFVPIIDPDNSAYWMNGENLIWEISPANQFSARLRFIDPLVVKPSSLQRKKIVEEGFHLLKKFVSQNESCKDIVWREYYWDKTLNALFSLDPSFPKNYRRVFQKLANTCDKDSHVSPSPKIRHRILLKTAIYGYCMQQIKYDSDSIQALRDLVGSLTLEDQFFESNEDRTSWFNAVKDALDRKGLKEKSKFESTELKKSIEDYIKNHVQDEPVFQEAKVNEMRLKIASAIKQQFGKKGTEIVSPPAENSNNGKMTN